MGVATIAAAAAERVRVGLAWYVVVVMVDTGGPGKDQRRVKPARDIAPLPLAAVCTRQRVRSGSLRPAVDGPA